MTLEQVYNFRFQTQSLKQRVAAAVAKAAQDVINESPVTPNHTNRVVWAKAALKGQTAINEKAEEMMWGVVGNATIQAAGEAAPDADIQFVVNSLIDTFAS